MPMLLSQIAVLVLIFCLLFGGVSSTAIFIVTALFSLALIIAAFKMIAGMH